MKTAREITNRVIDRLGSEVILTKEPPPCLPPSNGENLLARPAPTGNPWQIKWLAINQYHPKLVETCRVIQEFCTRWFRRDTDRSLLVLAGQPGCGKTHMAKKVRGFTTALAYEAFRSGGWKQEMPSCNFFLWPRLAERFINPDRDCDLLDDLTKPALLILDDIGAERDPFGAASDRLCQVLTERERRFTIVTTNIAPAHWEKRWDARIASRLIRNSVVADLTGLSDYSTL